MRRSYLIAAVAVLAIASVALVQGGAADPLERAGRAKREATPYDFPDGKNVVFSMVNNATLKGRIAVTDSDWYIIDGADGQKTWVSKQHVVSVQLDVPAKK